MSGHKIWTMWAFTVQAGSNKETILSGIVGNVLSGSFHPYQRLKVTTSRPVPQRFWPSLAYRLYGSATLILWSSASMEFFLALLPDQMNVQDHMSSDSPGQRRGLDDLALLRQKHVAFVSCNNCYAYLLMLVIHGNEVALWKKKHTVTTIIVSKK